MRAEYHPRDTFLKDPAVVPRLDVGRPIPGFFRFRSGILRPLRFLPRFMPVSASTVRRRRAVPREADAAAQCTAILVIDHVRLQDAAWAEFHTARKRLEKTTRDLHRHEETDVPAFNGWMHRTFPILITRLRELHEEVETKASKVQAAQDEALFAGGSLKHIWRKQREREANPEKFRESKSGWDSSWEFPGGPEEHSGSRHNAWPDDFEPPSKPPATEAARDIYRRLVQKLHPDRGGVWNAKREHLWHEVQQAWSTADTDWLARLEIEWETANEVIGPTSPLSRLRRAIEELHAARRDTERKLREYRTSTAWRFTQAEAKRPALQRRIESEFVHDIAFLQEQLRYLNDTIAAWEDDWTRAGGRAKPRPKPRPKSTRSRGRKEI